MCLGLFDLWGSLHVYTWRFCKVNSVLCAPYPGPQLWPQCRAEPRQTGMWPVFSELCGRPCWLQCSRHLSEIAVPSATDFLCMEELCPLCPYTTVHPGYLKKGAILLECVLRSFIIPPRMYGSGRGRRESPGMHRTGGGDTEHRRWSIRSL